MNEELKPYLVTTEHRGVFFGYAKTVAKDKMELFGARNCIYWQDTKGFLGLAANGPNDKCRIGPKNDIILFDITSAALVTSQEAIDNWEKAPWRQ